MSLQSPSNVTTFFSTLQFHSRHVVFCNVVLFPSTLAEPAHRRTTIVAAAYIFRLVFLQTTNG